MTNKGELFATCIADGERIFLIYKEVLQINKKKMGKGYEQTRDSTV